MERADLAARLLLAEPVERDRLIAEHATLLDSTLARALKTSFDNTKASQPVLAANAATAIQTIAELVDVVEVRALAAWTAGMAALQHAGQTAHALELLNQATTLFEASQRPDDAAVVQLSRMHALAVLGRYEEAIAAGQRALEACARSGDELTAGKVEQNLGNIYWRREQYADAERLMRAARARFERLGDGLQLTQIDNNLGGVLSLQYRLAEATTHYELALTRADALGLHITRAEIAVNLGCLALARGDYGRALAELEGARRRYAALDLPHKLANAEKELADAYLELNLLPEAADLYQEVIPTFERLGMRSELAWALAQHGRALLLLGRPEDAHEQLVRAREAFAAEGNVVGDAMVTVAEAELHARTGNIALAAASAQRAEELLEASGTPGRVLLARWLRGEMDRRLGSSSEAWARLRAVASDAETTQLPHIAQRCHTSLGLLAVEADDALTARAAFERAVELIEGLSAQLPAEEFRPAFAEDKLVPYVELVRLALSRGTPAGVEEAFGLADRARSRVLADIMAGGPRDDLPVDAVDQQLLDRVDLLRHELGWLYGRALRLDVTGDDVGGSRRGDQSGAGSLEAAVRSRESELLELLRQLAAARETLPAGQQLNNAVTDKRPALAADTALVAYFSLDDELLAFVLAGDRIDVVRGLASTRDADAAVAGFRFQVDSLSYGARRMREHLPQLIARTRQHLERLYNMLVRRLEPYLHDVERLVIVPHRSLHYLPFQALHDGERYLIERREVAYAPSVAVLGHCLDRPPRNEPSRAVLFGVADAGAPRVRDEVLRIAGLFPAAESFLDAAATLHALRTDAPAADVLHLATHGRFRPDNPLFSALQLADGWLSVRDARELDLHGCDLVVLSACETGVSQIGAGDELIGMARGFFASGAASLLVSLWPVDDATTVDLMDAFYRRYRDGVGAAAALRAAQREQLERHGHPFYWAAFALHGRW